MYNGSHLSPVMCVVIIMHLWHNLCDWEIVFELHRTENWDKASLAMGDARSFYSVDLLMI
jgi:hypothetical protein